MLNLGRKLRVGLDIGSHTIKAVVVEKHGNSFRVLNRAARPIYTEGKVWNPDGPKRSQLVPLLMEIFQSFKLHPKRLKDVRATVFGLQVAAKEIVAVPLEQQEMASAMLLEARKHIPLDGSETQVDYQLMGEHPQDTEKVRVLLAATTKRLFTGLLDTLGALEIRPSVVDIEPLAMANSYLTFHDLPDEGVIVMLNIGCRKTGVIIFGRKDMFFTREIPVAGAQFTEELMKNYGLEYSKAEEIKMTQGMNPDLPRSEEESGSLRLAQKSVIERFGDEINRTLRYYVKETSQSLFTKFVLVGGSANLPELREYLANKFNATVDLYDPFARLEVASEDGGGHPAQYAGAVGLAIREA